MKILFLTISRINEVSQRGIYTDLVRELIHREHEVFIVTPVERRFKQPEQLIVLGRTQILKVKTLNIQKTNVIEKGIGTLLLEPQFKKAIKKYWGKITFDLVIYSTPPITFNKVIEWQKKKGAKTYLMLKDIFPQNAVDLGLFSKKSLFYWMFRRKERKLYKLSDRIGCMSPANCDYVIRNNPDINPQKVEICPNCIEIKKGNLKEKKDKSILLKYNIPINKPLFIYGGNLGKPQGIDFLIELLDRVKDHDDLHICIVGSGTESKKLNAWYTLKKPKSVTVMDTLSKEEYDKLVSCADVGMIFLDRRFTIPNFPSRLLSYLENRQPVFLATDKNTDIGKIAIQNGFGIWCESGDIKTAINNITFLTTNSMLRKSMGENGYDFLEKNYTVDKAANTILQNLSE